MEKNEAAATVINLQPKKLARQLDFTIGNGILPEHPQAQLQSKLLALAKSRAPPPPEIRTQSPPKLEHKRNLQPQKLERKRKFEPPRPKEALQVEPPAVLHVQAPTLAVVVTESPKSRQRYLELKEGTPKKQKQCNCKNSRCLKLYCECFASGIYCDGCNCTNCQNNAENEVARKEAIGAILERKPDAFRPKIANSPSRSRDNREEASEVKVLAKHNKGCNCKKSGCLKKYCECFQGGILCSENCKCTDCKNFEASDERKALFGGNRANATAFMQLAANAAINGAIDSSGFGIRQATMNSKNQQLLFGSSSIDQSSNSNNQFQQENGRASSAASSTLLSALLPGGTMQALPGSLKFKYRSPLADIIKQQDVKELCSLLVTVSAEARKAMSAQELDDNVKENDEESSVTASGSDGGGLNDERAMSPGTLALLCDERDAMFTAVDSPTRDAGCREMTDRSVASIYSEQERLILTSFRNFINRLLTHESMRGTMCSPDSSQK